MKSESGITLIALVITIIVMLILVTVTIRISTQGNIFKHAANAVSGTKKAIEEENAILDGKIVVGDITYNSIDEYIEESTIEPHYGDANEDGTVDSYDSTLTAMYISYMNGNQVPAMTTELIKNIRRNCDVNLDGVINSTDITVLNSYITNQIPSLPYTGELP